MELQLTQLFPEIDKLHDKHGSSEYTPVYGAGQISNPDICLMFMNPTARNTSTDPHWDGIRAPWIGTKSVWKMLYDLGLFTDTEIFSQTQNLKPEQWSPEFSTKLYQEVANEGIYITNIAECTQEDARHIKNSVYREFLPTTLEELRLLRPKATILFGNQVSSIIFGKQISVSNYAGTQHELLPLQQIDIKVFPTYYPVGQGRRNMPKAKDRIKKIVSEYS